jgi:hypothetical protein
MQKIISLFQRNYETDRLVRDEVTPGAEWVINGEGIATRKWDGTCCMLEGGILYKRYDAKHGKKPPEGFKPAQDPDPVTGHWPGWVKINDTAKEDQWHREALVQGFDFHGYMLANGTYELIGPKINGNKHQLTKHAIVRHGVIVEQDVPRTFNELKAYFADVNIEGIVWHHADYRMVKIKKKDFGYKW